MRTPLICASLLVVGLIFGCGDDDQVVAPSGNPVPTLSSISPETAVRGSGSVEITATGSNFIDGSVLIWDGDERPTTLVSATELRATLLAGDLLKTTADIERTVWIRNPEPGGGTSGALPFVILEESPQPMITGVSPSQLLLGGSDTELVVEGYGFLSKSIVRVDEEDLQTTYVDTQHLRALVPASHLAAADTLEFQVFNPPPGGGLSAVRFVEVREPYPVPVANSLLPDVIPVSVPGTQQVTITVRGENFVPQSQVAVDELSVFAAIFVTEEEIRVSIPATLLEDGGVRQLKVINPEPGGGASAALPLTVENPEPSIESLQPGSIAAGGQGLTLQVRGHGFVPSTAARWNGAVRTSRTLAHDRIEVQLASSDVSTIGTATLQIENPSPGGGSVEQTVELYEIQRIELATNHAYFDAPRARLLVSIPSSDGGIGNTVTALDPSTGSILSSVFVGSDPRAMSVSDDGDVLYVALDGAAAVRRYELPTDEATLQFAVGEDSFFGPLYAEDIAVLPGTPGTVVISTYRKGVSPRHGGVFVYDDGVQRPTGTGDHTGSNRIEVLDASTLIGYNNETTEYGLRRLIVTVDGIVQDEVKRDIIAGFSVDIRIAGDRLYSTAGTIVDPVTLTLVGSFDARGPFAVRVGDDRILYAESDTVFPYDSSGVSVLDIATYVTLGQLALENMGDVRQILRLDDETVVLRSDQELWIVRSRLFAPKN